MKAGHFMKICLTKVGGGGVFLLESGIFISIPVNTLINSSLNKWIRLQYYFIPKWKCRKKLKGAFAISF